MIYFPHNVTVQPATEVEAGTGSIVGADRADGASLRCQISPLSASAALNKTGLELSYPHEMFYALADQTKVNEGDYIRHGARRFIVKTVQIFDALQGVNHCHAVLQEIIE